MQSRDFLVEGLGEHGDADGPALLGRPEGNLSEDLVRKGRRHDKGRMASSTPKIDEATLCKENDVVSIGEQESIDLGLDVDDALGILFEPRNINLNIKVSDIADDRIVLHLGEVFARDDIAAPSRRDENVALWSSSLHRDDFVTLKRRLKGVDGIDFRDEDSSAHSAEGTSAAFSDISVAGDDADFTTDHDVCSSLDAIDQRLTTAIYMLEDGRGWTYKDYQIWTL